MEKIKDNNIKVEEKEKIAIGFFAMLKELIWTPEKSEESQEEEILSEKISDSDKQELLKTLKKVDEDIMKSTTEGRIIRRVKNNKLRAKAPKLNENKKQLNKKVEKIEKRKEDKERVD